jgi:hypothetical protein
MTGQVLHEEFNEFRMSPYYWLLDTANGAHDTVANFKDGIKRDASLYPILRTALLSIAEILVVSLEKTHASSLRTPYLAILTDDVVRDPTVVDHTLDDDDDDDDDDALHPKAKHLRLDPLGGETSTIIESRRDSNESGIDSNDGRPKSIITCPLNIPAILSAETSSMDPQEDGRRSRTHRTSNEDHAGRQLIISPGLNSCSTNDDESEDIVSFTEILNRIEVTIRKRRHYGNPNTYQSFLSERTRTGKDLRDVRTTGMRMGDYL